jgi:hypothetical protein
VDGAFDVRKLIDQVADSDVLTIDHHHASSKQLIARSVGRGHQARWVVELGVNRVLQGIESRSVTQDDFFITRRPVDPDLSLSRCDALT